MPTFRLPAPPPEAFAVLDPLPSWLAWGRRLVERWAAGTRFAVDADGLRIRGTLYGRHLPTAALGTPGRRARPVDLAAEPALRPTVRTNGIGLPGYLAGWCRTADGRRVLAFVTDATRLVEIPTTRGFTVLLSVDRPAEFVAALDALPA